MCWQTKIKCLIASLAMPALTVSVWAGAVTDVQLLALFNADDNRTLGDIIRSDPSVTARVVSFGEERGDLLTMACLRGANRIVSLLVSAGANLDGEPAIRAHANPFGHSPLYLAASEGHTTILRTLIAAGADKSRSDHAGFGPLHAAAAFGRLEAVALLLGAGVSIDVRSTRGDTALKLAVMRRQDGVAEYLIGKGADPNIADVRGDTPLHEAVRNDDARMVRALLADGAGILRNRYGRTAEHEALDWAPALLRVLQSSRGAW